MGWSLVIVAGIIIGMFVGWLIGTTRGRPVLGALLGAFGLVGWVVMFFVPRPEPFPGADEYDPHLGHPHRPEHVHRDTSSTAPTEPPDSPPT